MTHLGTFGSEPDAVDEVTFDYFGLTLHANASLGELDYVDFLEVAGKVDITTPEAVRVIKDFGRLCIAEGDFDTFWQTAKRNRQTAQNLFDVLTAIVEAMSDRPTARPSSSAATPTTADTSSAPISSRLTERLEGRPDLQLIVRDSLEAQAAKAG